VASALGGRTQPPRSPSEIPHLTTLIVPSKRTLPILALLLSGCAFQTKVQRAPGAPHLSPSASAQAVAEAPQGAVALGTVTIQGNNWQNGGGCESQALFEAKKLGATHVVIRPPRHASISNQRLEHGHVARAGAHGRP